MESKYKFSKINTFAIADAILVVGLIIFYAKTKNHNLLYLAIGSVGSSLIAFSLHAIFGFAVIKNGSDSKIKILPEDDTSRFYEIEKERQILMDLQ